MHRPVAASVLLLLAVPAVAAPPALPAEVLLLPGVGAGGGRNPVPTDPVMAAVVAGEWRPPKAGDTVTASGGRTATWAAAPLNDGAIPIVPGGYAYLPVTSDRARVVVLQASGHGMVYVNGEPRAGDVYGYGYVRLPVALREGVNELLFAAGRGAVKVALLEPKAAAELDPADLTAPDLRVGVAVDAVAALPVRNCTAEPATDLVIESTVGDATAVRTPVPPLLPASVRKVPFRLAGPAPDKPGPVKVRLRLLGKANVDPLDQVDFTLNAVPPEATHRRTFVSDIDGSVQYFAVVPALPSDKKPGLVLTLHGASVEGAGQAAAYAPKPGLHIVAPTNRRPYGFDWEDWGRLDALEVLAKAQRDLGTDPKRTYLTGHSMGGHGTWHLGVTFPDKWAAIAPSAGWVSMWSYAGLRKDAAAPPERALLQRASGPSDTLALVRNLAPAGVYVLHGDADDNVRVDQARTMRKELAEFHGDFVYREQPGAGHWWGNACVDWPPLFEFLARHELPDRAAVRRVLFHTANPRVSADCHWLRIEAQTKPLLVSRAELTCDPEKRVVRGTTENVARLSLDLAPFAPGKPLTVELDGQAVADIPWPAEGRVWLARGGEKWAAVPKPAADGKGPHRAGPFKDAFRNRMIFVYGTGGTPAEAGWARAKARFDAETFWYRGNGSVDVVADTAFDPKKDPDRNVILYGHGGMNRAWKPLLGASPVRVAAGSVRAGDRDVTGDDLGVLLVRPRPGSDTAMVAAVAGTGPAGLRATDRLPAFTSGVAYPDWTIFDPKGVRAAGFFGNDWGLESGESAWRAP